MTEIADFLNNVTTKNFVEAEKQFSNLISARLSDRIEGEKASVAAQIFNNTVEEPTIETETEAEDEDV